ncbi:head processing protein [Pantoea eucrina]|uniref:head processing protein n=1 Tax=Pantoea eucrina TaxID=472693 RepID=UPI002FDB2C8C
MKALRTVTDRFSLIDKIRRFTPQNDRNYLLRSVRETFSNPETQERIQLGEMFGYYGHGRRAAYYAKTGRLNLPEFAVVMVDGKPVTIENVPSNRTLEVSLDDNGVVTHVQEILDTDPGNIVDGMSRSRAGGWSWATGGDDNAVSKVTSFHGFDYVTVPNYISLEHPSAMLESASDRESMICAGLVEKGYSENQAADIFQHFESMRGQAAMFESGDASLLESALHIEHGKRLELEDRLRSANLMIESAGNVAKSRRKIMKEALANMPLFFSKEQTAALCRMDTPEDAMIVASILKSIGAKATASLPMGAGKQHALPQKKSTTAEEGPLFWITTGK